VVPVSRAGVALWAWRHRTELADWAGFARRSVPRLQTDQRGDVIAEGRLRARLANDHRTRRVTSLKVAVADGVAVLSGEVPAEAHDAALTIAAGTRGIRRVRDGLRDTGRRRRPGRLGAKTRA
jgi:osmotically-inducible protein OsmY